jgi:prepilin-type N-terminal cleavage/methylation domain-containing protein
MRTPHALRVLASRLRQERGYTLVELLVAMVILGIIIAPLITSFTTALAQETQQARRNDAQSNARVALQRMRLDLHCATGVTSVEQNAYGGFTLTLTENDYNHPLGWCPEVVPSGTTTTGVEWCTIPFTGSTTRFVLYRYTGTGATTCNGGSGSTFQVDYLAAPPNGWPTNSTALDSTGTVTPSTWTGNIWPTPPTCSTGTLRTISVDMNVAIDPVANALDHYELQDTIGLRNVDRC